MKRRTRYGVTSNDPSGEIYSIGCKITSFERPETFHKNPTLTGPVGYTSSLALEGHGQIYTQNPHLGHLTPLFSGPSNGSQALNLS